MSALPYLRLRRAALSALSCLDAGSGQSPWLAWDRGLIVESAAAQGDGFRGSGIAWRDERRRISMNGYVHEVLDFTTSLQRNSLSIESRRFKQASRQITRAMNHPPRLDACFVISVKNQVPIEGALNCERTNAAQFRPRESSHLAQVRWPRKLFQGAVHCGQVAPRHLPTCFPVISTELPVEIRDELLRLADWAVHSRFFSRRTCPATASRSWRE